jgi:chitin deacetylase
VPRPRTTLAELNALPREAFVARLGEVFEHSPWVAGAACGRRPFASVDALHQAMVDAVAAAPAAARLALVRGHPELAGREASEGALTADSSTEQGRLGFTTLSHAEFEHVAGINRRFRERFGFPCIVALALHATRASVIAEMERACEGTPEAALARALGQIGHITRARLDKIVSKE